MLRIVSVTEASPILPRILALYERAFPANERRPLDPLLHDPTGSSDFLAFFDGDLFCGFACLLSYRDLTHILYFAIDETLRGRGYGSAALEAIRRYRPGQRILADLEADRPTAHNAAERRQRRRFYLKNGYTVSDVRYDWRDESYEILVCGGTLSGDEFLAFWHHFETVGHGLSQY